MNEDPAQSGPQRFKKNRSRKTKLAKRYALGLAGKRSDERVMGVEVNPEATREDIWIGSFDTMPTDWAAKFNLLYSNSFDHSLDPEKTVTEWRLVAAPGAYIYLRSSEMEIPHLPTLWGDYQLPHLNSYGCRTCFCD